jgi:hypothetical protein
MPISTRRATARKAVKARRWRVPPLHHKQILGWADAHHEETGSWPTKKSGRVRGTLDEKWHRIDNALRLGLRGLPRGDSLARVLARFRGVRNRKALPPFTIEQILKWVDAHFDRHGDWPTGSSGNIADAPGETWTAVEIALSHGRRGLPGGSSLARLLAKHRGKRNASRLPPLRIGMILKWADAYHRRTGMWPIAESGPIGDAPGETWMAVDQALRHAMRGLRGGSSLSRLLFRRCGVVPKQRRKTPLSVGTILSWADAYHDRNGRWPKEKSGLIPEAAGETWYKIQIALREGKRGLRGGSSLAKTLAEHRGVRNVQDLPNLTTKTILAWADAYRKRRERWPTRSSGPIDGTSGETWNAADMALARGLRGLPGGSSLAKLLAERRGVQNRAALARLSAAKILAWADSHHRRTGMWPAATEMPIAESPNETWRSIDGALRKGMRGLRGDSSLAQLLEKHRGVTPKHRRKPPFSIAKILEWADDYRRRTGRWPTPASGTIPQSDGDSWISVHLALRDGLRGLDAGSSLGKLWARYRGARNLHSIPRFSISQVLAWADAHFRRTGNWPQVRTGPIVESPGDNWFSIDNALRLGLRGMRGGSSLKRLLDQHRRNRPTRYRSRPSKGSAAGG